MNNGGMGGGALEDGGMRQRTEGITNHFVHRTAAKRYAAGRPYFHPLVMDRIVGFTKMERFGRALDIGCGTGQSARALAAIAERVDAIDISPEMIAEAELHERVHYAVSPAERMPFADKTFDLATVGLAFHWFDQGAFLREAGRILKSKSWLIVYSCWFAGEMLENAEFCPWSRGAYVKRFPTPARRSMGVSAELLEPFGLALAGKEDFAHEETMTAEGLTDYLLTQTNVIAAVEAGSVPVGEAAEWILGEVKAFFRGKPGTMKFGGSIWYVRRSYPEED